MPIIVLEGPDESGKTHLAQTFKEHFTTALESVHVEVQRSPVKEMGWSDEYNHYLASLSLVTSHLIIQDRTPEISESIYGHMRGNVRTTGWVYEVGGWFYYPIFMVFCLAPYKLENMHKDAEGLDVKHTHEQICLLYDYTFEQIDKAANMSRFTDFQVAQYNRFANGPTAFWFYWQIANWLTRMWPHERARILESLYNMTAEVE